MSDIRPATKQVILLDNAIQKSQEAVAMAGGMPPAESQLFSLLCSAMPVINQNGVNYVPIADLRNFINNLKDALINKDWAFLTQRRGLKVDKMVDVEEFVKSKEYMGQGKYVRPAVMQKLIEFWNTDTYVEAALTGSIGWGKNYFADLCVAYMLYRLSCYWNPQLEFGLALGSSIIFIVQSKTKELATKVAFNQLGQRLAESEYFKNNFMYSPRKRSELEFPRNITLLPIGGGDTAALGLNIFGGLIDEMNFMNVVVNSVRTRMTGGEEYDQAERIYNTLLRRIKSRFLEKEGKIPGRLILISSSNYPDDFMSRKEKAVELELETTGKTATFFVKFAQWDTIPSDRFSGERFRVAVGDTNRRSKILIGTEECPPEMRELSVPVEYKADFERDIEGALRDLAGIAAGAASAFIPQREHIVRAQEQFIKIHGAGQLFKFSQLPISTALPENVDWEEFIDVHYLQDQILMPEQAFSVHIDVGLNKERGDAAGIAVGRIFGYKLLPAYKYYNERRQEFVEIENIQAPIYHLDGLARVVAPAGEEIDLALIRDMMLWLRARINIKWITMDTYQNVMLRQAFKRARIKTGDLSVDVSIAPYMETKMALKDDRIIMPPHEIALRELGELRLEKGKVDHRPHGSKDVSDAIAGVIYILQHKEADYKSSRQNNREAENRPRSFRGVHAEVRQVRVRSF